MAKVCGAKSGLIVLFLLYFTVCNSFQVEKSSLGNIEIKLNLLDEQNVNSPLSVRSKRQATGLTTEYKSVPEANVNSTPQPVTNNQTILTVGVENKSTTTDVKQEPPGTADTGGIPNISTTVSDNVSNIIKPLVGVNGTGQRKDYSSTPKPAVVSDPINPSAKVSKTQAPKKATMPIPKLTLNDELLDTDEIDVADNETQKVLADKYNITQFNVDYHLYYNSSMVVDEALSKQYWESFKNVSANPMLSKSHRRAMTVKLSFDFPFYGHPVRNVTVATGGFLYTGEYVHSWLAATQYIAPLMANFDTSLSNDSFVKLSDNGTAFTVIWENVALQDKPEVGNFTFSTTLHQNGDIVFAYFSVPILIESIQDDKHPVKVGLSDAYIIDKIIFFARRKTIYEYHRVNFASQDITNSTIIYLNAQPTCLMFTDCVSCLNHGTKFVCAWCPTLNKCSTGTDRKRQDWIYKGCDKMQITDYTTCPAKGQKGNNASQQAFPDSSENDEINGGYYSDRDSSHEHTIHDKSVIPPTFEKSSMEASKNEESKSSVGIVLGLMIPICLIMSAFIWIFYAYRNPHTKSGQLLIQYRPSQWTWRRGEARYTAATIHM